MVDCWLCKKTCTIACPECDTQACTENHLSAHYTQMEGQDNKICRPIRVEYREGAGNCLVATRNIQAGSVILQESPALVSPSLVSPPVCLDCLRDWKGSYLCEDCGFPVCNTDCQKGNNHKQECSILSQLTVKPTFVAGEKNPATALIGVIRFLELNRTEADAAERMSLLMDHVEDIKASPDLIHMWEGTAVHQLVHQIPNSTYTKEAVLRAVGVLHTNSVSGMGKGHALYPTFSLTNHSCVCNSRFQIYPDRSILLRAQVGIPEGAEITTQYLTPLIGTMQRRKKIRKNWFFDCSCARCSDPTEMKTFLSGIICRECQDVLLPLDPLDYETAWKCGKCPFQLSQKTVEALMASLQVDLENVDLQDLDALEEKADNWEKVLHPHNYLFLQLKRNILSCLKLKMSEQSPRKLLTKMTQIADQNIAVFDQLDPGLTILRGRMIQNSSGARLQIAKLDLMMKKITRFEFLRATAQSIQNIKLATRCFEDYQLKKEES